MSGHDDPGDSQYCAEVYDTAAALMAITHPNIAGGMAALGTHLAGVYSCSGGTLGQPGPPPDYFGGKLGYDPGHDAPPTFSPPPSLAHTPSMDMGSHDSGFDYAAADNHSSGGGFDFSAADTHGSSAASMTASSSESGSSSSASASSSNSSSGDSSGSSSGSI
jgi:hypothetical protein